MSSEKREVVFPVLSTIRLTKRELIAIMMLLSMTFTLIAAAARYAEKKLDENEMLSREFTQTNSAYLQKQIDNERHERIKAMETLNGKLDTITGLLIQMKDHRR